MSVEPASGPVLPLKITGPGVVALYCVEYTVLDCVVLFYAVPSRTVHEYLEWVEDGG